MRGQRSGLVILRFPPSRSSSRPKDTSRQGRWYNAKSRALAEELGIEVTKNERICWSTTGTPAPTREAYVEAIDQLSRAVRLRRAAKISCGEGTKNKPSPPACVCACGRRIRVAPSVLELGPILCSACGQEFCPRGTT